MRLPRSIVTTLGIAVVVGTGFGAAYYLNPGRDAVADTCVLVVEATASNRCDDAINVQICGTDAGQGATVPCYARLTLAPGQAAPLSALPGGVDLTVFACRAPYVPVRAKGPSTGGAARACNPPVSLRPEPLAPPIGS